LFEDNNWLAVRGGLLYQSLLFASLVVMNLSFSVVMFICHEPMNYELVELWCYFCVVVVVPTAKQTLLKGSRMNQGLRC
jgi:hypothetical protein